MTREHSGITLVQLLWLRPGARAELDRFEAAMAPIMARHGGRTLMRSALDGGEGNAGDPDEVQVVHFETQEGLDSYLACDERRAWMPVKDGAVVRARVVREDS